MILSKKKFPLTLGGEHSITPGCIEPFVKKAYDLFLKKNNQSYGIKSYGLVVNLLIYDYQSKIKLSSSPSI